MRYKGSSTLKATQTYPRNFGRHVARLRITYHACSGVVYAIDFIISIKQTKFISISEPRLPSLGTPMP